MPIAYTADADVFCPSDAVRRYGGDIARGVPADATDSEGNLVHPVFAWDDIPAHWRCGDCLEPIR